MYSILYIDDEPDNLLAFKAVFRRHYAIFAAQSGYEALAILQTQQVDLIISDQRMPRMTGVEFFERIHDDYPDAIRMILTGYSDVQAIVDAINKGKVYHYITKPWKMEELKVIMDNALEAYTLKVKNKALAIQNSELRLKTAQQEKVAIQSQFEALKNQVNPHFLFNSMNVLASLIAYDAPKAIEFTNQFAKVYRTLLERGSELVITLKQELDFVTSFLFLQQMRFEQLDVTFAISDKYLQTCVPPFALQLLIENAIKHNVISEEKPLKITVFTDEDYLVVSNPLQLRGNVPDSTGIGLKNLTARYEIFSSQVPTFGKVGNEYIARLPLILEG
ncbi:MAG: response regulator [Spirosomataceae bacterium]